MGRDAHGRGFRAVHGRVHQVLCRAHAVVEPEEDAGAEHRAHAPASLQHTAPQAASSAAARSFGAVRPGAGRRSPAGQSLRPAARLVPLLIVERPFKLLMLPIFLIFLKVARRADGARGPSHRRTLTQVKVVEPVLTR